MSKMVENGNKERKAVIEQQVFRKRETIEVVESNYLATIENEAINYSDYMKSLRIGNEPESTLIYECIICSIQ